MNGEEIDTILKKAIGPKYVGVFASDEIQPMLSDYCNREYPFCFIANTHSSSEPGEHWVAFYVIDNDTLEFFDSYGQHPHVYFPHLHFVSQSIYPLTLHYNNKKLQKLNSSVCGHYCLYYLYLRVLMHKSLISIVNSLSALHNPHPDQSVKSFFIRVFEKK